MKCCDITAGMLRHKIAIERKQTTPDGVGGFTTAWTPIATPRAHVKDASGTERIQFERINAQARTRFTVRYRSDVRESDRIVFRDVAYNIRHLDNLEYRNRWLVIDADRGVAT